MAAITIPAYQDYTIRAKTTEAVVEANQAAAAVGEYLTKNGSIPRDIHTAGYELHSKYVQSININHRTGELRVVMAGPPSNIDGKAFLLTPSQAADGTLSWSCSPDDLPAKYLPMGCRN